MDILNCNENDVRHKLTNNVKRMEDDRMCVRNTEHISNEKQDSGRYFKETGG
jgi:hypothetical protein